MSPHNPLSCTLNATEVEGVINQMLDSIWFNTLEPALEENLREAVRRMHEVVNRITNAPDVSDNTTEELVAFAQHGNKLGFVELAKCVMPTHKIEECWIGTRARLGLSA